MMESGPRSRRLRLVGIAVLSLATLSMASGSALAHSGSLRNATPQSFDVPTWLFLATGGGVVGASFLLASFVTDRQFIHQLHDYGRSTPTPGRVVHLAGRVAAVGVLAATLVVGLVGPVTDIRNLAILVVWVAWWGGYVASTYLLGNTWPTLNPFRAVADAVTALVSLDLDYPDRLGAWPSIVGLLVLIWIEVVTPLAENPRLLSFVIAGYTVVTVAGAVAFGTDRWFDSVDPISRAFRAYGRVAPVGRTDDGLRLRLPGSALAETDFVTSRDDVAFVVALLFVTTYDGFVATGLWASFVRTVVGFGVPPLLVYLLVYLLGYVAFYGVYRGAAYAGRRTGETYLTADYLALRFAPSLLAIAAGYHLAHNLGTVLSLLPTLLTVVAAPLSPPQNPPVLAALPGWFGGLELSFVLLGHVVAVWVAHATAYDLFPGRLQAVRSQYGVTLVMVAYTMVSLWIVSTPFVSPPFL
jgi:hypothetical protein